MTAPRVSIVTPVWNAGSALEQALTSVSAQTFTDWEHVLVDDGSTDAATLRVLDSAAARPKTTVLRTENRGPAAARNHAIAHARGIYVLPLDADDYLDADCLARTVALLDAEASLGVVHPWVGLVGGHVGTWKTGPFEIPALLARCTVHVTTLFRRALWVDVGGFDPAFTEAGEDWDFWIRLAARGTTARAVPEVLAYYRRTRGSREDGARAHGKIDAVMRRLLAKHADLYATHAPEVVTALYVEVIRLGRSLERLYAHPLVRLAVQARELVRKAGA